MESIETLLSDEFVEFSNKIRDLHEQKKAKKEEAKRVITQFQEEIKAIESEAESLIAEWESSKANKKAALAAQKT